MFNVRDGDALNIGIEEAQAQELEKLDIARVISQLRQQDKSFMKCQKAYVSDESPQSNERHESKVLIALN